LYLLVLDLDLVLLLVVVFDLELGRGTKLEEGPWRLLWRDGSMDLNHRLEEVGRVSKCIPLVLLVRLRLLNLIERLEEGMRLVRVDVGSSWVRSRDQLEVRPHLVVLPPWSLAFGRRGRGRRASNRKRRDYKQHSMEWEGERQAREKEKERERKRKETTHDNPNLACIF
jgi:hypothetical protein